MLKILKIFNHKKTCSRSSTTKNILKILKIFKRKHAQDPQDLQPQKNMLKILEIFKRKKTCSRSSTTKNMLKIHVKHLHMHLKEYSGRTEKQKYTVKKKSVST